jgi:hypothetical protein
LTPPPGSFGSTRRYGHQGLPPAARDGPLGDIARLIDGRYGGRIEKRYLTELRVARRRKPRHGYCSSRTGDRAVPDSAGSGAARSGA